MSNEFQVSPQGHDQGTGSAGQPFATLGRAVAAARERSGARQIVVRGGVYWDCGVSLTADDNGLSLVAADGEKPVLYGGRRVTGWRREGEFLVAPVPEAQAGTLDFRALVVAGEFRPRARLPETGAYRYTDEFNVRWMSSTYGGWERKPTEEELTTLHYTGEDLGPWLDVRNAEIQIYHMWDESLVGVRSLDPATRAVRFASPSGHPPGSFLWEGNTKARQYVLWNVREGLKRPGQWYLDRTAGRLVYWPLPGETAETLEAVLPTRETILALEGEPDRPVRDVLVQGLALRVTTTPLRAAGFGASLLDGAVSLRGGAAGVQLRGLLVECVSGHAVKVQGTKEHPTQDVVVDGCTMRSLGAGAVRMAAAWSLVGHCRVRDAGLLYPSAVAIAVHGEGTVCRGNDLDGTSYSAFNGGGAQQRFECNVIRNFMRDLDDGAAIYVFGGKGTVYRGNAVYGAAGRWASAYYLDEQCEKCIVEDNLAVDTRWPSHNHMARENIIRGNTFVDREGSLLTWMRCEDFVFERNVVYAGGPIELKGTNVLRRMPNNVFFSRTGEVRGEAVKEYAGSGLTPLEMREGSVIADPLFRDAEHGDYDFKAGSPALARGIRAIEAPKAGPRE
jgi:hypothetical protein